ncbi:hypothetical protein P153DRAFT_386662 [Dothidotthia symphoricarpi CBS 119687]|uniref:Uncharacterized protein n=1 Tax=Dothidotthia symphoricarpi CBS 119687 TaxID=1392245 RepID=A0A6A6ABL1_9PLEO|nr:uncharacterized protein P153DRAFT_386662 [Dothidotthia symphoricarpi CBS 119687]KAF2128545.1 hypothetical protein P153DRAFT_386662 [Dothidotthia symphoricarpi CBS 119687]
MTRDRSVERDGSTVIGWRPLHGRSFLAFASAPALAQLNPRPVLTPALALGVPTAAVVSLLFLHHRPLPYALPVLTRHCIPCRPPRQTQRPSSTTRQLTLDTPCLLAPVSELLRCFILRTGGRTAAHVPKGLLSHDSQQIRQSYDSQHTPADY